MAAVTPGMARIAFSASARTLSHARTSAASTLIDKNTLPSARETGDSTFASLKLTPRGDFTLDKQSRTCCCVTLKTALLTCWAEMTFLEGPPALCIARAQDALERLAFEQRKPAAASPINAREVLFGFELSSSKEFLKNRKQI